MRERIVSTNAARDSAFPASLSAHVAKGASQPVGAASAAAQGRCAASTRLLAETADPQADAEASVHTLALRAAEIPVPRCCAERGAAADAADAARRHDVRSGMRSGAVCLHHAQDSSVARGSSAADPLQARTSMDSAAADFEALQLAEPPLAGSHGGHATSTAARLNEAQQLEVPSGKLRKVLPDRKSTRLNSSHFTQSRMPSSA